MHIGMVMFSHFSLGTALGREDKDCEVALLVTDPRASRTHRVLADTPEDLGQSFMVPDGPTVVLMGTANYNKFHPHELPSSSPPCTGSHGILA